MVLNRYTTEKNVGLRDAWEDVMRIHSELKDLVSICFNNYPLKNENVINLVQAYTGQTENKLAFNDFDQRASKR